ncbi:hypothetical protein K439DRAFT_795263 [Ramaria rubella]|nr:hypothetical protein K439DRAFT_795263 [Ramaria rubella]
MLDSDRPCFVLSSCLTSVPFLVMDFRKTISYVIFMLGEWTMFVTNVAVIQVLPHDSGTNKNCRRTYKYTAFPIR